MIILAATVLATLALMVGWGLLALVLLARDGELHAALHPPRDDQPFTPGDL